jgi:hypothetical protein
MGQIELFIKDTAGQKIVLHTAEAGDMFGEELPSNLGNRSAAGGYSADDGDEYLTVHDKGALDADVN